METAISCPQTIPSSMEEQRPAFNHHFAETNNDRPGLAMEDLCLPLAERERDSKPQQGKVHVVWLPVTIASAEEKAGARLSRIQHHYHTAPPVTKTRRILPKTRNRKNRGDLRRKWERRLRVVVTCTQEAVSKIPQG